MITTTVTAHTGTTKRGTYKVVTGTLVEYVRRDLGPNHYTLDVVIIDAEGVTYVTGKGRIIKETVTVVEDSAPEAEQAPETVWVPVGKGDEVELTWPQVWQIHRLVTTFRSLRRGHENFASMRVLREIRNLDLGLTDRECKDVANWADTTGGKLALARGRQAVAEWRAKQGE